MIHSIDAYLLRTLIRRCDYDQEVLENANEYISLELMERHVNGERNTDVLGCVDLDPLIERFKATNMVDSTIFPLLNDNNVVTVPTAHLERLLKLIDLMSSHRPFPVLTVHDEFKCHANNVNQMRFHYKEIMAELAESTILDDILCSIYGSKVKYQKHSTDLGQKIRNSNYALS